MTEFKRGQAVYDVSGYEYLYSDRASDGHYVNKITLIQTTSYMGDDFDEHQEEGELVFIKEVFSKPPKKKLNAEIKALAATKKELADCVYDLERTKKSIVSETVKVKEALEIQLKSYPHHKMFLHLVNGGDIVIVDTSDWSVINSEHVKGTLQFNVKTGEFTGEYEEYYNWDDSVQGSCVAFKSTTEAARSYLKNADLEYEADSSRWNDPKNPANMAKKYELFDLPIPHDIVAILKARKEMDEAHNLANLEDAVKIAKADLKNFKLKS